MKDLFLSECRRFKNAALIFAAVHLLLQLYVHRITDLLNLEWQRHVIVLLVYMAFGLGFALYQLGTQRQPSRWLWLLHRPLPRTAIFGAISLASGALILFAVGLPALLALLGTEWFSGRTVDLRHYMMVLQLLMLTMMAWLGGACVILSHSRSAIVILLLPFMLIVHMASGFVMLLPYLLCLALLAFITHGVFKPDRLAPPAGAATLAATALPLQIGFYLVLVWAGSIMYQNGLILFGVHPLNGDALPAGGVTETRRAEAAEVFLLGLAKSADARAPQWRRQLPLLTIGSLQPDVVQYQVRHEITNRRSLKWVDDKRRIVWTFSHDAMRYHGSDAFTGQDRGWFGLRGMGDAQAFPAAPYILRHYYITPSTLSVLDPDSGKLAPLVKLSAPETLASIPRQVNGRWYVITNRRLIAYAAPADGGEQPKDPLVELFSIALPGPFIDLSRIDIAGLLDGSLISFTTGRYMAEGSSGGAQTIMLVDAAGRAQVVAERPLLHDFALLFEHYDWWVSPVLHTLYALPNVLLDKGYVLDSDGRHISMPFYQPRPRLVWLTALLFSLLSALAAWAWLRKTGTAMRQKAGWIAACLLLGPPSVACLMVLQPRSAHAVAAAPSKAALAAA